MYKILTLNLGTASTKVALYEDATCIAKASFNHPQQDMDQNPTMSLQLAYRKQFILNWLEEIGESMDTIHAAGVRIGTSPHPLPGGTYLIEGDLEKDIMAKYHPDGIAAHGTLLALPLMQMLMDGRDIKCFFTDPTNIDELAPVAKLSGHPLMEREPIFHALNQRMVAITIAEKLGKPYSRCNFIVAHLGGGLSVGAHQRGKVIEVNNCYGEEGGFSTTRCGHMPFCKTIELCYSGQYTQEQLVKIARQTGGVVAYLGTNDMREVERRIEEGDAQAALVFDAMAYQTAKQIGACAVALEGDIDCIIITGGISNSQKMVDAIRRRVAFLGGIFVVPGEMESDALAFGALRVLRGEQEPKTYNRIVPNNNTSWSYALR